MLLSSFTATSSLYFASVEFLGSTLKAVADWHATAISLSSTSVEFLGSTSEGVSWFYIGSYSGIFIATIFNS